MPPSLNFSQLDFVKPSSGFHPVTWERVNSTIYKRFQEEINNQRKENVERQSTKKRSHISNSSIFGIFVSKDPFKKDDVEQKMFVENLTLLILKNHLPL